MDLSLVMSIGNDDYGNKIYREVEPAVPTPEKDRTDYCLFTLREAFKNIDYELIIVEWLGNETGEKPSDWGFLKDKRTRVIRAHYEFTKRVCPERPFHETHAKNIGIRRAQGEMILTMNNDCLWLDKFPPVLLKIDNVVIADRPTVYHNILQCNKDIGELKKFCYSAESVSTEHDYNSNGDFTLLPRKTWRQLKGLCTPPGDKLAGVDMWQIVRAEHLTGLQRQLYPHPVHHIRHPGAPLDSGYGKVIVSEDWGFPNEVFEES